MSGLMEYGGEEEYDDEEDFLTEEERLFLAEEMFNDLSEMEEKSSISSSNMFSLNTWFIVSDVPDAQGQIACKLILPNPKIMGIEISIEICEFLLEELDKLLKSNKFVHITAVRAISNSMFIIQNMLDNELNI